MVSYLGAFVVVATVVVIIGWLVSRADNRSDAAKEIESAMVAESSARVRAVLAMRGHMLHESQREAAEQWLADAEIKDAASAAAAAAEAGKEASDAERA